MIKEACLGNYSAADKIHMNQSSFLDSPTER